MGMPDAMKNRYRQRIGKQGEENAVHYLKGKGYCILERNYRSDRGEIDIIAENGGVLVFIEVKMKIHEGFGSPESWVDRKKQAQIGKVAAGYLLEKEREEDPCRFDVIAITQKKGSNEIHHIEDAFWMDYDMDGRFS
jgi:putative endonuclease